MLTVAMNADAKNVERDPRWRAIVDRDAKALFFYAVITTGVYCRPECPSRRPKPANVEFYDTRESARAAGYRACRRCKPDEPPLAERHAAKVAIACRLIESAEEMPSLNQLADASGLSRYHFHRIFKDVTGMTPKTYSQGHRAKKVRETLPGSRSVTDAIYDTGFQSSSRFYDNADRMLGMKPSTYRKAGADEAIRFAVGASSLGAILVAATEKGICAITLGDDAEALVRGLQDQFPKADLIGDDAAFETTVARVVGLVEAPNSAFDLPLDLRGTAFQLRVWQALREIPVGTTASYREIAEHIGRPKAVRAVAQACGSNRVAVAVPCHRVVRADGSLSGYRWGVDRKRGLLQREGALES